MVQLPWTGIGAVSASERERLILTIYIQARYQTL